MYHYTECGLDDVWLENGYKRHKTPYGAGVAVERARELHRTIALHLITSRPRLSGAEFRYLRKMLDMSQAGLARIVGKDEQSIARWEKSDQVPKLADRFLRALYREHAQGNAAIVELVDRLNQVDQRALKKLVFEEKRGQWQPKAA